MSPDLCTPRAKMALHRLCPCLLPEPSGGVTRAATGRPRVMVPRAQGTERPQCEMAPGRAPAPPGTEPLLCTPTRPSSCGIPGDPRFLVFDNMGSLRMFQIFKFCFLFLLRNFSFESFLFLGPNQSTFSMRCLERSSAKDPLSSLKSSTFQKTLAQFNYVLCHFILRFTSPLVSRSTFPISKGDLIKMAVTSVFLPTLLFRITSVFSKKTGFLSFLSEFPAELPLLAPS